MDKEYTILGNSFVKFNTPSDNVWEVSRVVDLSDDELKGIVDRCIKSGKDIFVYESHKPKETREIVGQVEEIKFDNGIKASIIWNDKGNKILGRESRYPSVELKPNEIDSSSWDLYAIAMVGEPASKDVDVLELSALENNGGSYMDELKEIIEMGIEDPEAMRKTMKEMVAEDPSKAEVLIDMWADSLLAKSESEETIELVQTEEDRKDESIGTAEYDEKEGDDTELEEDLASKEKKSKEDLASKEKRSKEDLASKDEKSSLELTAYVAEFGAKYDKGTAKADSLSKAIELFKSLKNAKMTKSEKLEAMFNKIEWVLKKEPVSAVDLSSYEGNSKPKVKTSLEAIASAFGRQI